MPITPRSARPKLTATTVSGRVKQIREWMGLKKTAFGKRIGSGYQLIHMWDTGKKRPSIGKLNRVAKISGYKVGDILDGTEDADRIDYTDEDEFSALPTEPMTRGDALAWVDDRDEIPEPAKQRLRNVLRMRPDKLWTREDLEDMVALLMPENTEPSEQDAARVTADDRALAQRELSEAGGQRPPSEPPASDEKQPARKRPRKGA